MSVKPVVPKSVISKALAKKGFKVVQAKKGLKVVQAKKESVESNRLNVSKFKGKVKQHEIQIISEDVTVSDVHDDVGRAPTRTTGSSSLKLDRLSLGDRRESVDAAGRRS